MIHAAIPLAVYGLFAVTFGAAGWALVSSVRDALPVIRRALQE